MSKKHVFVTKVAVRQAIVLDLVPNDMEKGRQKIAEMAVNSAPFTHARVNRRFGDVGLMFQDNTVTRVVSLAKGPRGRYKNDCDFCGGTGRIPVPQETKGDPAYIPCTECSIPRK